MVNQVWVHDKTQELLELKAQKAQIRRNWEHDRHSYTDKLDDQLADTMRALRRNNTPITEIMREYGTQDRNTVRNYLGRVTEGLYEDSGLDIRTLKAQRKRAVARWRHDLPNRTATIDDNIAIVIQAMRDEGLSQGKIAKLYGTTNQETIKGYLEREC